MLLYWDICVNVDDDTLIDTALLMTIDEEAVQVTEEEFEELTGVEFGIFTDRWNIEQCIVCVYPSLDDGHYGFIYDIEKDIHYLFRRVDVF